MSEKPAPAVSKKSANSREHLELLRKVFGRAPFLQTLGIAIADLGRDKAVLKLPFQPPLARNLGVFHGGALASLIDTAGGVAAFSDHETVETLNGATINMLVNYLSPAPAGQDVTATARVRKRGKSIVVTDVDVATSDGTLVATGTVTFKMGSKVGQAKPLSESMG